MLEAINLRVGPGKILIPDLAVTTRPGLDVMVVDAAEVALVVEITLPENITRKEEESVDRAVKPALYAQAGILHYLRVELGSAGPQGYLHRAEQGRYREVLRAAPGEPLVLAEPLRVTLDLGALGAATRGG